MIIWFYNMPLTETLSKGLCEQGELWCVDFAWWQDLPCKEKSYSSHQYYSTQRRDKGSDTTACPLGSV